ncbi:hypothetical protein [Spirochaeta isovalerica]|uniref:Uncharacterized protein n=1 Tax=Spirochaeta isovalerica TaxID=150 RepID=A0A841RC34_9SPIO|nr:hypothetical protein [Spirochaeta isovalerica]MBB6480787.1 hypothetical protein [Spirochaeta isovalerica]
MIEVDSANKLNLLSSRAGFNLALRHFKRVLAFSSEIDEGENLADLLNEALDESEIQENQIRPIISSLLIQKFNYQFKSHNLIESVNFSEKLIETLKQWTAIELVLLYYNPSSEISVINPKNQANLENGLRLVKDELLVAYAGSAGEEVPEATLKAAAEDFLKLLYGEDIPVRDDYKSSSAPVSAPEPEPVSKPKAPAPKSAPGKRRVTTKYGVQVTNEVFHNGNVEAWKKIIDSYTTSHPGTEILVWYEDEKINDINALFKWGKVKHGCPIMFSVAGEDIRDVSKLKKYLFEGASPRFEAFLRGAVGSTLDLF